MTMRKKNARAAAERQIGTRLRTSDRLQRGIAAVACIGAANVAVGVLAEQKEMTYAGFGIVFSCAVAGPVERKTAIRSGRKTVEAYKGEFGDFGNALYRTHLRIEGDDFKMSHVYDQQAEDDPVGGNLSVGAAALTPLSMMLVGLFAQGVFNDRVASDVKPIDIVLTGVFAGTTLLGDRIVQHDSTRLNEVFHRQLDNIDGGMSMG